MRNWILFCCCIFLLSGCNGTKQSSNQKNATDLLNQGLEELEYVEKLRTELSVDLQFHQGSKQFQTTMDMHMQSDEKKKLYYFITEAGQGSQTLKEEQYLKYDNQNRITYRKASTDTKWVKQTTVADSTNSISFFSLMQELLKNHTVVKLVAEEEKNYHLKVSIPKENLSILFQYLMLGSETSDHPFADVIVQENIVFDLIMDSNDHISELQWDFAPALSSATYRFDKMHVTVSFSEMNTLPDIVLPSEILKEEQANNGGRMQQVMAESAFSYFMGYDSDNQVTQNVIVTLEMLRETVKREGATWDLSPLKSCTDTSYVQFDLKEDYSGFSKITYHLQCNENT